MAHEHITLATLRTRLFERVDVSQHWVNAEALIKINDAIRFWNVLTGYWRKSQTKIIQPASDPYNFLTGDMTWPLRMELLTGADRLVEKTSIAAMDMGIPGWEGQSLGDTGLPDRITFWAPRSLQHFVVWPKPAVPPGGTAVTVIFDGIAETPVLVADGDFLDLEDDVHDVILDYAAHLLQFKDGGPKFFSTAGTYQALIALAGDYNEQLRSTTIYKEAMTKDTDRDQRHRTRPFTPVPSAADPLAMGQDRFARRTTSTQTRQSR